MKRNTKIFLGVMICSLVALLSIVSVFFFRQPVYVMDYGEYKSGLVRSLFNGMCSTEKVWKSDTPHWASLFELNLCEDNIKEIYTDGDWVVVKTDREREIRKNIKTGEELEKGK